LNRRRSIATLATLAGAAIVAPATLRAQSTIKIPRVAVVMFGSPANFRGRAQAFQKAMQELGYVENRNVQYEWRSANGQEDLLRSIVADYTRQKPDVILSASTLTTRALHLATKTTPIVMGAAEDPAADGFVATNERPGGNITGVSAGVLEVIPRQVELLLEASPRIKRIAALLDPSNATYRRYRTRLEFAMRTGIRLVVLEAGTAEQIERVLGSLKGEPERDGLMIMNDPLFYNERRIITEQAARLRLPAMYSLRGFVETGGLMSYGPNPEANFARAAYYVDRILKGAKPGDLPVEPPAKFELALNMDTARALRLTLKPDLVKQATTVVE
jgi:putative tryptophan/tyrosine transport system substrate-binding protein